MCNMGVRQGENLSPYLFSLYINNLENYLKQNGIKRVTSLSEKLETEMYTMLKLFIHFYADDTVTFSENPDDLQKITELFF